MNDTTLYFRAEKPVKKKFDVAVAGTDFNNKQIFTAFIEKFACNTDETLKFIGLENA